MVGLSAPSASGSFEDKPPLTPAEAEAIVAGKRFAIVNVWQSTSESGEPVALTNRSATGQIFD